MRAKIDQAFDLAAVNGRVSRCSGNPDLAAIPRGMRAIKPPPMPLPAERPASRQGFLNGDPHLLIGMPVNHVGDLLTYDNASRKIIAEAI